MRTKFLIAAIFVAALISTASVLMPTEASPGLHAAITAEDAMTVAVSATPTTPLSATEVTCVDACEVGTAVALTTTFAAIILTDTENAAAMVMKKPMASGSFNGVFTGTSPGTAFTKEVAFAAREIAGAAIAFA